MHNPDLFDFPGHRGIATSIEAAKHIAPHAAILRDKVLTAVTDAGAFGTTVVEMATKYGIDRMGAQPRFSELRLARQIADSGLRRKNPSGVSAIVWTLPQSVQPAPEGEGAHG